MTDDLVTRLREEEGWYLERAAHEAADHIEELEEKLFKAQDRSELLWQHLVAISATVKGDKVDVSGLFWPSFVTDVRDRIDELTERNKQLEAALRYVDANMVGDDDGNWQMLPDFRYGVIHAALGEKKDG